MYILQEQNPDKLEEYLLSVFSADILQTRVQQPEQKLGFNQKNRMSRTRRNKQEKR